MSINCLQFPISRSRATRVGASKIQIVAGRVREKMGMVLNRLKLPGFISDGMIEDQLTGHRIEISQGILFTKISINGRDYYFDRLTGKFGGTGCGCS